MAEDLNPSTASARTTTRTSALSVADQIRRDRVHSRTPTTTRSPPARGRRHDAYADFGVQPLDLARGMYLRLVADLRVERTGSVLLKLLLPGVYLVRVHLRPPS